ncbi:HNH endonuclease [Roseomonas mucosa]|uniref:HNH endonuclease n=1 Tax=Roseomonas mucosa TaxID=207340 RepID=UPI002247DD18|nr:HNH endonuclease [Roseomonas mucosa]
MNIALPCGRIAIVDDEDAHLIAGYRWYSAKRGCKTYVEGRIKTGDPKLWLHRLITDAPKGLVVDHIDGDGLNNRRGNLRLCKQADNVCNTRGKRSGKKYKGVYYDVRRGNFYAQIYKDKKSFTVCGLQSEEAAARAYDALAIQHHGRFALLNFPEVRQSGAGTQMGWLP